MKRFIAILLSVILTISALVGCGGKAEPTKVRISGVMNSPTALLSHMIEKSEGNVSYVCNPVNLPNRIRHLLTDGECDIAVVPIDTACNIYKKANPEIKVIAGISVGGFELVSTEELTDLSNLKDKTVFLTERDSLISNVFEYLIKGYGLTLRQNIEFNYADDIYSLKESFKSEKADFALLTSAEAAAVKSEIKGLKSYNITDELAKKFNHPSIITYCVIGNAEYIENNPDIIKTLLKDIESSLKKSQSSKDTVKLGKKHNLLTDDVYGEEFLSACKPDFISGEAMKTKLTAYFKMIRKFKSSLVNKVINKDDFFYIPKSEKE